MKTKKQLLGKIIRLIAVLAVVMLVVGSCKKKDDIVTPAPTPAPVPTNSPDAFADKQPSMMSDYERAHNLDFPGHLIREMGKGLRGEDDGGLIPEPFKKMGETAWEVHDYIHTEARFDQIDNALSQIQNQLTNLQTSVNSLSQQLGFSASWQVNVTLFVALNALMSKVQSKMGVTSTDGLQYYPHVTNLYLTGAKNNQGDSLESKADFLADQANLQNWANQIYNNNPDLTTLELTMYNQIKAAGTNGFAPLANLICQSALAKDAYDPASIMNCYLILEGAFLQLVSTQVQCGILMSNAHNYFQPQDTVIILPWYGSALKPHVYNELKWFQDAVNYMVVNLNEYRSNDRFVNDMQYMQTELAPDNNLINILARAQFVSNLIYDALGYNYPVVAGTILTPYNFTDGASQIVSNVTLNFAPQSSGGTSGDYTANASTISSVFPYTYWSSGNPANVNPDNKWNLYRFLHDTLGSNNTAPPYTIQIVDNGSSGTPWVHYKTMSGTLTPRYYNPRDPSKSSLTPNNADTCVFQFGYFCSGWPWGYLYLSNYQMGNWTHPAYNIFQYTDWNQGPTNNTPFTGTSDSHKNFYEHSGSFSYPGSVFGGMQMGGNAVSTDNYYMAVDLFYTNVNTGGNLPTNGGQIQTWALSKSYYSMNGSGGSDLWVTLGVGLSREGGSPYYTYQSDAAVINQHYHNQPGNWGSAFGNSGNLKQNTQYQPAMQYYYQTYNIGSVPASIQLINAYQMLYGGLYAYTPMQ